MPNFFHNRPSVWVLSIAILLLNRCAPQTPPSIEAFVTTNIDASARALQVVSDNVIWFAGSKGTYGFTQDGGKTWSIDSITIDSMKLEFRSLAVTSDAVYLLCVGSPALMFKSVDDGASWSIVYREDNPKAFYDAMAFWNDQDGIAMGDPTDSCLSVIITHDGGQHWSKLSCNDLPTTATGEAAFAASNTNIALSGDNAWLVTGGTKARVFHSSDKGTSWSVYETPITQGSQMTGIYSVAFLNDKEGIVIGGNWEHKDNTTANKAITKDGGITWSLVADGHDPGYRSCVRYIPGSDGTKLIAVGDTGISYSIDGGLTWSNLSTEGYYTVSISPSGNATWVAGNKRISRINWK